VKMEMIELNNVSKKYVVGKAKIWALRNVSLKIERGEFVAVVGPSGSGKSTLLHILGFLDRPTSGSYRFAGKDITKLSDDRLALLRNKVIGFVFQQFYLLPNLNAVENVTLPLIYAGKRHLWQKAHETLKIVGLARRETHRPNELSGGEQQRIAIARALVNDPLLILADEPTGNLDTKTGEEIVALLKALHERGITIVMVTHDRAIAEKADRIIEMKDGQIVSDSRIRSSEEVTNSPTSNPSDSPEELIAQSHRGIGRAKFIDHLRQAFHAIVSHKLRSALSMLGIFIGIIAVIAMLTLSQGLKEHMANVFATLGSKLLVIRPGVVQRAGVALERGAVTRLTLEDAEAIAKLPHVKYVDPVVRGSGQAVYQDKNMRVPLLGAGVYHPFIHASNPEVGSFFTEDDIRKCSKVAVIGSEVAKGLFPNTNPIGKTIKINRVYFRVIGVLPEKGVWRYPDDQIIMPVTTAIYRIMGKKYLDSIDVEVDNVHYMPVVEQLIRKLYERRHRLGTGGGEALEIINVADITKQWQDTNKKWRWFMTAVAAVSLLVGGIGVMNVMLLSVTERTREIGLRKAIGACRKDILTQFLIESVSMSFMAEIAGVPFALGVSWLLMKFLKLPIVITPHAILLATPFAIGVGIASGLWPARRAAMLDPIQALRYE